MNIFAGNLLHLLNATAKADPRLYTCINDMVGQCATLPPNTSVLISKSTQVGELLTLTRTVDGKEIAPVGRSYDGYNWERVAGPYDTLEYDCNSATESGACQVTIPEATVSSGQSFVLSRFVYGLNQEDRIARFLEQTTFGTKPGELRDLSNIAQVNHNNNLYDTFGYWVYDQMYQISPTSHREFFRSRVSPRFSDRSPAREGKMSDPCKSRGRWRRSSFSLVDLKKDMLISKTDSNKYALSVDGYMRTVVDNISFKGDDEVFQYTEPVSAQICALAGVETFSSMGITYKDKCRRFRYGNPPIDIVGMRPQPQYIVELIDPNQHITTNTIRERDRDLTEFMLLSTDLSDKYQKLCDSIVLDPYTPIFVRLTNSQVLIFDPTLELESNSVAAPMDDGGAINSIVSKQVTQCSNVPRTFLNENNCHLSSTSACNSGNTLDMSLTLNEKNLKELYSKTGRYYYVVEGLRFDDYENYLQPGLIDYPCAKDSKSRWVKMSNNNCVQNVEESSASKLLVPHKCCTYVIMNRSFS